jgi:hypothetical protein
MNSGSTHLAGREWSLWFGIQFAGRKFALAERCMIEKCACTLWRFLVLT